MGPHPPNTEVDAHWLENQQDVRKYNSVDPEASTAVTVTSAANSVSYTTQKGGPSPHLPIFTHVAAGLRIGKQACKTASCRQAFKNGLSASRRVWGMCDWLFNRIFLSQVIHSRTFRKLRSFKRLAIFTGDLEKTAHRLARTATQTTINSAKTVATNCR
jgi:hypothetical protein